MSSETIVKIASYVPELTVEDIIGSLSKTNYVVIKLNQKKLKRDEIDEILDYLKLNPINKDFK